MLMRQETKTSKAANVGSAATNGQAKFARKATSFGIMSAPKFGGVKAKPILTTPVIPPPSLIPANPFAVAKTPINDELQ